MIRIDSKLSPQPSDLDLPATRPIRIVGWIPEDPEDPAETS
jgi:hypothetical protein